MKTDSKPIEVEKLVSLGCAYHAVRPTVVADPEKTLFAGLDYFWTDKSRFDMLLGLMRFCIGRLINIERLTALVRDSDDERKALLLTIAHKMILNGDKRYEYIIKKIGKRGLKLRKIPERYTYLESRYKSRGVDKSFLRMGARLPDFFGEEARKFYALKEILGWHPWLRIRSLVGPNYRADIIYLKSSGEVLTPRQAGEWLGCSRSTAYRIWCEIEDLPFFAANPLLNARKFPAIMGL